MKTLVLTVTPAFPPRSGGDLRNAAHIRAAAALGPVMAVSLAAAGAAEPGLRQEALSTRNASACWKAARGRPPGTADIRAGDRDRLRTLVHDFAPDTVIVEGVALSGLMDAAASGGASLILDMHNIESDLYAQIAASRISPLLRAVRAGRIAAGRLALEQAERRAATTADMVWVCSGDDARRLKHLAPEANVEIVPNSLPRPPRGTARARAPDPDAPALAFVGQLHYRPNVHAAGTLARTILPAIWKACPGAALTIAGSAPSRHVVKLHAAPRITVVAGPDDVGAILEAADFAVLPLTEGGGTRIKALEAMAAGLAVIATPRAVEGLELKDGRDAIIRDTPDALAAEVVRLARSPEDFLTLANTGRTTATALGDPARHAARVQNLLRETMRVGAA